jgi:hypothetical protein
VRDRLPHLELIEVLKLERAHQKLSDQVTDQAGRFSRGSGAVISGDLSAGESLNALLADDEVARCSLAISGAIHKQLLEALDAKARTKIVQSLASNLTKTDPQALTGHFARAGG